MKVMEAIHNLIGWFDMHNIKYPRVTLEFEDPRDYYAFDMTVRTKSMKEPHLYPLDVDIRRGGSIMGVRVDVVAPHPCGCDICKMFRDIRDRHKFNPVRRS